MVCQGLIGSDQGTVVLDLTIFYWVLLAAEENIAKERVETSFAMPP